MEILNTPLKGCFVIRNDVFEDARGCFTEGFNQEKFLANTGVQFEVKQINLAKSGKKVLRGLHYQLNPFAQAKLVGVITGAVLDVVVDLRSKSPTFGHTFHIELRHPDRWLFVPRGFAHGYEVLEDETTLCYAIDNFYSPEHERGLRYDDPHLNINWRHSDNTVSEKDKNHPFLDAVETNF